MKLGWVYHERFLDHDTGPGHVERPERLEVIASSLRGAGLLSQMVPVSFEPAGIDAVCRVHEPAYVDLVRMACEQGMEWIGSTETRISSRSFDVALLAAGGVIAACDAVMDGRIDAAFCAVRPPGHHAERDAAGGYCLFNNVAVAAEHLIRAHGVQRVAIVDFDAHHGNGTQHIFEERADVLYASLHEHPRFLFPGTGWPGEVGRGAGEGFTVNVPLAPGSEDGDFRAALSETVLPALDGFRPGFLLISAGFDAAAGEEAAHLSLSAQGFADITRELAAAARRACGGRLVSILEGGYNSENLKQCVPAHVRALLDAGP